MTAFDESHSEGDYNEHNLGSVYFDSDSFKTFTCRNTFGTFMMSVFSIALMGSLRVGLIFTLVVAVYLLRRRRFMKIAAFQHAVKVTIVPESNSSSLNHIVVVVVVAVDAVIDVVRTAQQ